MPGVTGEDLPREIIEAYPNTSLSPGRDDFIWGASLRLKHDETTNGSNIIQKGFSLGGGSQWKLQVDGAQGHPSCVLVGMNETQIHEVLADKTIADDTWHDVSCRRTRVGLPLPVPATNHPTPPPPHPPPPRPGPGRIGG